MPGDKDVTVQLDVVAVNPGVEEQVDVVLNVLQPAPEHCDMSHEEKAQEPAAAPPEQVLPDPQLRMTDVVGVAVLAVAEMAAGVEACVAVTNVDDTAVPELAPAQLQTFRTEKRYEAPALRDAAVQDAVAEYVVGVPPVQVTDDEGEQVAPRHCKMVYAENEHPLVPETPPSEHAAPEVQLNRSELRAAAGMTVAAMEEGVTASDAV